MSLHAIGYRGSWFAIIDGERLPCVHQYWLRDGRYEDPGCMPKSGKWPKFVAAIEDGKRVLLTDSKVTVSPGRKSGVSLSRKAYVSVLEIDGVEADEKSLRFNVVSKVHQ